MKHSLPDALCATRPRVEGKFLTVDGRKFYIKGVTYGTFRPDADGNQFPDPETVDRDFRLMACSGINAVRTYTVPPVYLLDLAALHGLKVMVGLPWEQHITFLDDPQRVADIIRRVQEGVRACASHPAVLSYTIGNEIPAPIVRWYGRERVEKFLHQLYESVKAIDAEGLVTYVNYPTTEYLRLPFLDFDCFNVYLESEETLSSYLSRLHNLTGDRPMVLAEIGLDSMRNGEDAQAEVLDWQVRTIFAKGCAGTFVFAWTDEWWRGGYEIEDWDFGLVDRDRVPKPALKAVSRVFSEAPFAGKEKLPRMSVVVCSYNGSATIRDCMEGLLKLDYPDFEVIVVNDGSTDRTAQIVAEYPQFRLISTKNQGLSAARNTGIRAAAGEIVAFIDDDAYPDPHWLRYLAYAYQTSSHAGIGGPNIIPESDGPIAQCVANAPGGPVHVLTTDEIAEHIPGCNMSFRRDVLLEIGGFDPLYRTAGDDVDLCWRVQNTGRTIGFHPSAMVWHHRRNSVKAYWRQQKGYGRAEALLERKWPEKYNRLGHLSWAGRIYGNGVTQPLKMARDKIFQGTWGTALFQSVYQPTPGFVSSIPLMPEWYLIISLLAVLSVLGIFWTPLLAAAPFCVLALAIVLTQAGLSAARGQAASSARKQKFRYWALTAWLHFIQPIARLYGRFVHGLTPWRRRGPALYNPLLLFRHRRQLSLWSETNRWVVDWLQDVEQNARQAQVRVVRGGVYDHWDLKISCSFFTSVRGLMTVEEHGGGKQLVRFRCWTTYSFAGIFGLLLSGGLSGLAAWYGAYAVSMILLLFSGTILVNSLVGTARAMLAMTTAFEQLSGEPVTEAIGNTTDKHEEPILDEAYQFETPYALPVNVGASVLTNAVSGGGLVNNIP